MTWTGGFAPLFKGVRTFVLTPQTGGATTFVMQERFSGLMLPLILAPGWIAAAADLNPFYYAIDAASSLYDRGVVVDAALRAFVVAGALTSLAIGWAVHSLRRVMA